MNINDETICTIISTRHFCDFQKNYVHKLLKQVRLSLLQQKTLFQKISFYEERNFRTLVLSKQSKENLNDYVVPKEIRLDVLKSLPNRKDIIQIDEHNCVKYWKDDTSISVITCYRKNVVPTDKGTKDDMVHVHFFFIDLQTGEIGMDQTDTYKGELIESVEELVEKFYSKFLVLVTYLELTEVKFEFVESILSKKRKSHLDISNTSRYNIIHVKSNWNTRRIILSDIHVRGHWRLQPYGSGRSRYKYIKIEPFTKGLTKRLSQKELI